jgi:hypothetical protein
MTAEVAVYSTPILEERGDRQMRRKARVLTLIGVLTSSAVGQWLSRLDFYRDGRCERQPMQPDLEGAGLLRAFGNSCG